MDETEIVTCSWNSGILIEVPLNWLYCGRFLLLLRFVFYKDFQEDRFDKIRDFFKNPIQAKNPASGSYFRTLQYQCNQWGRCSNNKRLRNISVFRIRLILVNYLTNYLCMTNNKVAFCTFIVLHNSDVKDDTVYVSCLRANISYWALH